MTKNTSFSDLAAHAGLTAITERRLNRPISRARLEKAFRIIAGIVAGGDHRYLPIFLRLEKELDSFCEREEAIQRAQTVLSKESNQNQETNLNTF